MKFPYTTHNYIALSDSNGNIHPLQYPFKAAMKVHPSSQHNLTVFHNSIRKKKIKKINFPMYFITRQ